MSAPESSAPLPDAVYRMTFGSGVNLPHGALAMRQGTLLGAGQVDGVYEGRAQPVGSTGHAALDISTRVPTAFPFATGLKAGPAGSSLHFTARGALPTPSATFAIDLVGHRGSMTLDLVGHLDAGTDVGATAQALPPHPDAFPDGIYRLASGGVGYVSRAVLILSRGQLCGAGEMGGRYRGNYVFDPIRKVTRFDVVGQIPPNAPLIVGGTVGTDWLETPLSCESKFNSSGRSRFSFSLLARSVDAELTLIKPLPE